MPIGQTCPLICKIGLVIYIQGGKQQVKTKHIRDTKRKPGNASLRGQGQTQSKFSELTIARNVRRERAWAETFCSGLVCKGNSKQNPKRKDVAGSGVDPRADSGGK